MWSRPSSFRPPNSLFFSHRHSFRDSEAVQGHLPTFGRFSLLGKRPPDSRRSARFRCAPHPSGAARGHSESEQVGGGRRTVSESLHSRFYENAASAGPLGGEGGRGWRDACGDRGPVAGSVSSYWEGGECREGGRGDRGGSIRRRARGLRRMLEGRSPERGGSDAGLGAIPKSALCDDRARPQEPATRTDQRVRRITTPSVSLRGRKLGA
jgi:hypothetical protein